MTVYEFSKSSYSGGNAGQECVEVARNIPGVIAVRDSKAPDGAIVRVGREAWVAFVRGGWEAAGDDGRAG